MAQKGYIYKGLKPVYWCPDCNTALAEAEIEYEEDPCFSIYVKFPVKDDQGKLGCTGCGPGKDLLRYLDYHYLDPAGQHGSMSGT